MNKYGHDQTVLLLSGPKAWILVLEDMMARTARANRLDEYERRYRELAAQLAEIGFISSGSVTRRYTRCGTQGCKCHDEPPKPHGPYYQWTAKVNGKTVTRRLSAEEAKLYQEWITNDRRMRRLIQQMRQVATKAGKVLVDDLT
ncbi:MAG: DUF6788 family protein [Nitrososphaerales archaeon]